MAEKHYVVTTPSVKVVTVPDGGICTICKYPDRFSFELFNDKIEALKRAVELGWTPEEFSIHKPYSEYDAVSLNGNVFMATGERAALFHSIEPTVDPVTREAPAIATPDRDLSNWIKLNEEESN